MTAAGFTNTETNYLKTLLDLLDWISEHDTHVTADPRLHGVRQLILHPARPSLRDAWALLRERIATLYGSGAPIAMPAIPGSRRFDFDEAAAVWLVTHNLQARPALVITDGAGHVITGDVDYPNANQAIVSFGSPQTGSVFV